VTLSDLEWPNGRHYELLLTKRQLAELAVSNSLDHTASNKDIARDGGESSFANVWFVGDDTHYLCSR